MQRRVFLAAVLIAVFTQVPVSAVVLKGETAPMFTVLDENMEAFDMETFIDGTPLVFIYGTAT